MGIFIEKKCTWMAVAFATWDLRDIYKGDLSGDFLVLPPVSKS